MRQAIDKTVMALEELGKPSPWNADSKASDDFLVPLFKNYFKKLELPNAMPKKNFHQLVAHIPDDEIDPEIKSKLNAIAKAAAGAKRPT